MAHQKDDIVMGATEMAAPSLRIRWIAVLAVLAIAVVLGACTGTPRSHAGTNWYSHRHVNAGPDDNGDTHADVYTHFHKRPYAGANGCSGHDHGEHPNAWDNSHARTHASANSRTHGSANACTHGSANSRTHGSANACTHGSANSRTHGSANSRTHGSANSA